MGYSQRPVRPQVGRVQSTDQHDLLMQCTIEQEGVSSLPASSCSTKLYNRIKIETIPSIEQSSCLDFF